VEHDVDAVEELPEVARAQVRDPYRTSWPHPERVQRGPLPLDVVVIRQAVCGADGSARRQEPFRNMAPDETGRARDERDLVARSLRLDTAVPSITHLR
jgi:hypothetical protein